MLEHPEHLAVVTADRDQFNLLLRAAARERPREPIILGLSAIAPDQRVSYGELIERYHRLAIALGEHAGGAAD